MLKFLKTLFSRYGEDEISNRAAALSYFAIFSIGPLLFLILGVVGLIIRNENTRAQLLNNISNIMGPNAAHALSNTLSSQGLGSKTGLAFWVGGIGLVLGAIGIFGQLQKSLNEIFRVEPGPDAGRKPLIRQKVVSLALVGIICVLMLAAVTAPALISSLGSGHGWQHFLFFLADFLISTGILSLVICLLYRFLPAVKIAWGVLFKGSLIVAFLFSVGKLILGLIIGRNGTISAYGAAGSLIALLLWIFYSGQIFYLGAAGIRLFLDGHEEKIVPRYGGKKGVMRLIRKREPLKADTAKTVSDKFLNGLWRGFKGA